MEVSLNYESEGSFSPILQVDKRISAIVPLGPRRRMDILQSLQEQEDQVNIIVEVGTNPSRNRNTGIRKANTEFVAFLDAHAHIAPDWAYQVMKFFDENPDIDIVGGPRLPFPEENTFGKLSGFALSSIFGAAESSARYKSKKLIMDADERHITSANLICRYHVLQEIGFDESLYPGEDPKFISDAKSIGFKVAYCPDIIVYHKKRNNANDFSTQIFKYGQTRAKKEKISVTLRMISFIIPSLFVIYLCLFPILVLVSDIFLLPLLLYLLISLAFSISLAIENKTPIAVLILPFIFFMIHISYGVGFIYGKLLRWTK